MDNTIPAHHVRKGLAYYIYWDNEGGVQRPAAQTELVMMMEPFRAISFEVEVLNNPTKEELFTELNKIDTREDLHKYNGLWIMAVSLRTEDDCLMGKDGEKLSPRSIVEEFVKNEHKNLEEKPKMFFFQAAPPFGEGFSSYTKHGQGFPVGENMMIVDSAVRGPREGPDSSYRYIEMLTAVLNGFLSWNFHELFLWMNKWIDVETLFISGVPVPRIPEIISTMAKDLTINNRDYTDPGKMDVLPILSDNYTATIFNYYKYSNDIRDGSKTDVANIQDALECWKIPVTTYEDLRLDLFENRLREAFNGGDGNIPNITFLMCHGIGNRMILNNGQKFDLETLNTILPENRLNIVIVQMCRSKSNVSYATSSKCDLVQTHSTQDECRTFPITARNTIMFWSTFYGDPSQRHYEDGGFFIQDLCRSLKEYSRKEPKEYSRNNLKYLPFSSICRLTSHRVREHKFRKDFKQIPVYTTTLVYNEMQLLKYFNIFEQLPLEELTPHLTKKGTETFVKVFESGKKILSALDPAALRNFESIKDLADLNDPDIYKLLKFILDC